MMIILIIDNNIQYILVYRINFFHHFGLNDNGYLKHTLNIQISNIKFDHIGIQKNNSNRKSIIFISFRKRWYDNITDIVNRSLESFTFTDLIFESIVDIIFEDMVLKQIERVLRIIQIYHLEILEKNFSTSRVIQAVNLLPAVMVRDI